MKNWTIRQLIDGGFMPTGFTHFNPGEITAIPFIHDYEIRNALRRYGERVYLPLYLDDTETIEKGVEDITSAWTDFHHAHDDMAWRLYSAFAAEYKPLENYSMTESGEDTRTTSRTATEESTRGVDETLKKTGTITHSGESGSTSSESATRTDALKSELKRTGTVGVTAQDTGKTTDGTTRTTTNTGTQSTSSTGQSINGVSAYDGTDFSDRDKQTNSTNDTRTDDLSSTVTNSGDINTTANSTATTTNDTTDTTTDTGTQTNALTGTTSGTSSDTQTNDTTDTTNRSESAQTNTTDSGTDKTNHSLTRSGNIGVTTSQQMLTSEVYLRARNNLLYYIVELFISQYTTW